MLARNLGAPVARASLDRTVMILAAPGEEILLIESNLQSVGVTLEVPHTDPLDLSLRELLRRLLDARSPADSEWVNIRTDQLPWRQLVVAAERGEVLVSRVGRKLLMRRAELDRWLQAQAIEARHEVEKAEKPAHEADISHLVQRAGFGGRSVK